MAAQPAEVVYEYVGPECNTGKPPGSRGSVFLEVGKTFNFETSLSDTCELTGCVTISTNPAVHKHSPIIRFGVNLPACYELFPLGSAPTGFTVYAECDGDVVPLLSSFLVGKYAGSIGTDACEGKLATNSHANVWYERPGIDAAGFISLPQPIIWTLPVNPCGAQIQATGPDSAIVRSGDRHGTITVRARGTNTECYVERDLEIVGPENTCSGQCSPPGGGGRGGPRPFGEGNIWPGTINAQLSLGTTLEGESAGFLQISADRPTTNVYDRRWLEYRFRPRGVQVLPPNYEPDSYETNINQILTPQGLVTVSPVSGGYDVKFFALTNVGTPTNGGYTHVTNSYLTLWQIKKQGTGSNQLEITKSGPNITTATWRYQWLDMGWALTNADAAVYVQEYDDPEVPTQETISTYSPNGTLVHTRLRAFAPVGNQTLTTMEIEGEEAHTSTYDYYTNGLIRQVVRHDGSWEYYLYDNRLRPTNIFSAFGTNGVTTNSASCRLIEHSYETNWVSGFGDAGVSHPVSPRRTVERVLDEVVSCTYYSYMFGETREIRCLGGTNIAAAGNLTNITKLFTNGFHYGEPKSIEHPDGTMQFFEYVGRLKNDVGYTNIVSSGVPDSYKTNIVNGTKTVTIKGPLGQLVSETRTDIESTITIARQLFGSYDVYSRPQAVTNLDGTWEFSQRFCCGDIVTTNREGTVTTKTYDVMNRPLTTTTAGITHSNVYHAAGSILKVIRIGTNGNPITLEQHAYDTAGHRTATTNAVGDVTLFEEAFGASGMTNVITKLTNAEAGPSRIEARYLDGQVKSITGGLVHPVRYEYGPITTNGGGTFTKEIKLDANGGDTAETVTTLYDLLGRPYRTTYGDGAFSQTFYNRKGQMTNQVDPDGVSTLLQYNGSGEQEYTVLDMNRNGVIDFAGADRIIRTLSFVTNSGFGNARRSETYVWAFIDSNAATLQSVSESHVSGLSSWSASFGRTNRTTNVYAGSGVRWMTNIAPDGSFVVSKLENIRIISSTRNDSGGNQLGQTTFSYDEHGRQKFITDARNGTTTQTFDNADRIISTETPAPALGVAAQKTGYLFDNLNRVIATTNADDTVTYSEYFSSGELKLRWGSRVYPVEYTYDYAGRMETMKTWQNFNARTGDAVTTWKYNERGFPTNKVYADGKGPHYQYTPAGRLYQRTWARGITTTYTTNTAGEIASIDYSDGTPDVTYTFDRLGRRTNIVDGAGTHVLIFDVHGDLLVETNNAGVLAGFAITNGYDFLLRRFALGLVTDASTLVNYGYDGASRLIGVTNGGNTATYSYVANSPWVEQITFRNSGTTRMTTTKSYDFLNRFLTVTNLPSAGSSDVFNYVNNTADQRTSITNVDGSRWAYSYDALGQVTSGKKYWSDGTPVLGQQFEYTFDHIGNRKTAVTGGDELGRSKRTQIYTVNNLNQYAQRAVPGYLNIIGTATNNATVTVNSGSTSRKNDYYHAEAIIANSASAVWQSVTNIAVSAVGTNDMVTNTVGNLFVSQTPETFGYDADGNMTNDGRWRLTWDGENRLIQMQSLTGAPVGSSNRLTFIYDHQGRRVSKTTEVFINATWNIALSNRFIYDAWNLVAELNATNNAVVNFFTWGLDLSGTLQGAGGVGGLLAIYTTNAGTHFAASDGNGNVAALVSVTNGTATANYEYDPFSSVLRVTGPMALLNPFRFSTKYTDGESGFNNYGYRLSSPQVGRWLSKDPINEKGGLNLYGFVDNSPNNNVDFIGLIVHTIDITAKSWIAKPIVPGTPYSPAAYPALMANVTAIELATRDAVTDDRIDRQYRFLSWKIITVDCCGSDLGSFSGSQLFTDVGMEGPITPPPALILDNRLYRGSESSVRFVWTVAARPHPSAEDMFATYWPRSSVYIWHTIIGSIRCVNSAPVVSLRMMNSKFPSADVFYRINGAPLLKGPVYGQGAMTLLWNADHGNPLLVQ